MYNVGFSYMYQNFAANGYVVFYLPNPRGSTAMARTSATPINRNTGGVTTTISSRGRRYAR